MPAGRTTGNRKGKETDAAALRRRIAELSARLDEAEATLSAIRAGAVDAVIVAGPGGDRVFTLEGAEHAYRIFLEDMGEGAATLTREGVLLYANRRFAEIVDVPLEQIIGNAIFRFLSPSGVEALRDLLSSAMAGHVRGEVSLETPRGSVPTLLSINLLPENDPPALCMVVTDLTERERTQQMLLEAHRTVAASEQRFRFLVDRSLVGFFIVTEGRIVFANAEQQRIFGSLPIPAAVEEVENVHPEDRERFERLCNEESVAASGTMETDLRFRRGGDTEGLLWAHCRAAPIEYQGGKAVLVNMADVTQAREMEKIATLQDKMASLGELTAGIAHNIRNPLAAINIYISSISRLLDAAVGMEAETKMALGKYLEMLLQGSRRIGSVIRQVLAFARPSPTGMTRVLVDDAIRETVKLCRTQLRIMRNNNVAVDVVSPEGLPPCYAGRGVLEQVFMNVINNAAQALETHPGDRRIAIHSDLSDGFIVVRIGDSGPGVPENIRSKIFEPFYTTRAHGTGIGLAFSRRVMDGLGGNIEVGDSPLGGAEFRIRIPSGERRKGPRNR
jgi:PAS domain S-box-containing protein